MSCYFKCAFTQFLIAVLPSVFLPGRASWLPPHYILGCGLLLLVSLFSYLPASGTGYLKYAALGCLVLGMPPVLLKAWVALRGWQVDINVLMTVAVAGGYNAGICLQQFAQNLRKGLPMCCGINLLLVSRRS